MSSPYDPNGGAPGGYQPQQGYSQYPGYGQPGYDQSGYGQPPQGYGPERGYLQGGPVSFVDAFKLQFANIFNFQARASQSAYWWYALGTFVVNLVLEAALGTVGRGLAVLVGLTALSLAVRRLHDSGKSGFHLLWCLTFFGAFWVLYLVIRPGNPGPNRFG